jgi:hypothetical protein
MVSVVKINAEYSETLFSQNVKTLAEYLYVVRGCRPGRDLDNWIEAETRLKEYLVEPSHDSSNSSPSTLPVDSPSS